MIEYSNKISKGVLKVEEESSIYLCTQFLSLSNGRRMG